MQDFDSAWKVAGITVLSAELSEIAFINELFLRLMCENHPRVFIII